LDNSIRIDAARINRGTKLIAEFADLLTAFGLGGLFVFNSKILRVNQDYRFLSR
jgi:hypothetical protein